MSTKSTILFITLIAGITGLLLLTPSRSEADSHTWPQAPEGPLDSREEWPNIPPIGQLSIPTIELEEDIFAVHFHRIVVNGVEGIQPEVRPNNVGWQDTSSATLGEPGNVVLNGHHFENDTGVFRRLIELEPNDAIAIENYVSGTTHFYRVDESFEVLEKGAPLNERIEHAKYIDGNTPDERVTMITCDGPHSEYRFFAISRPHEEARTIYEAQAN